MGSSKEDARFQRPTLPVLEAVAKRVGWVGLLTIQIQIDGKKRGGGRG